MKWLAAILAVMLSFGLIAQPTINSSNIPRTGDSVLIAICSNTLDPGNAGMNQTWDMSNLTESQQQYFVYKDPANTPNGSSYPTSTICGISWDDDYAFYKVDGNSLSAVGYVTEIPAQGTSTISYTDDEIIAPLPYTFGTTNVDSFAGTSVVPPIGNVTFDGTIDFEADGYGTLILPNGTYNNVVRYHFTRTQQNYAAGFPSQAITKEQWAWVSADYRFWLLLMEENDNGFNTSTLIWYDKNPFPAVTGLTSDIQVQDLEVFLNPVQQGAAISLNWDTNEEVEILMSGLDGRSIMNQNIALNAGINTIALDDDADGMYFLEIIAGEDIYRQKILVIAE